MIFVLEEIHLFYLVTSGPSHMSHSLFAPKDKKQAYYYYRTICSGYITCLLIASIWWYVYISVNYCVNCVHVSPFTKHDTYLQGTHFQYQYQRMLVPTMHNQILLLKYVWPDSVLFSQLFSKVWWQKQRAHFSSLHIFIAALTKEKYLSKHGKLSSVVYCNKEMRSNTQISCPSLV